MPIEYRDTRKEEKTIGTSGLLECFRIVYQNS